MEKRLGKIQSIKFGIGGYQDAMIGLHITLGSTGWGVTDTKSAWDAETVQHTEHCKWTEKDRDAQYAEILRYVSKLLNEANVTNVNDLKGKPVEVTFNGNLLKEWRILTEVL